LLKVEMLIDAIRDRNIPKIQKLLAENPKLIHTTSTGGHAPLDALFLNKGAKCANETSDKLNTQLTIYAILYKAYRENGGVLKQHPAEEATDKCGLDRLPQYAVKLGNINHLVEAELRGEINPQDVSTYKTLITTLNLHSIVPKVTGLLTQSGGRKIRKTKKKYPGKKRSRRLRPQQRGGNWFGLSINDTIITRLKKYPNVDITPLCVEAKSMLVDLFREVSCRENFNNKLNTILSYTFDNKTSLEQFKTVRDINHIVKDCIGGMINTVTTAELGYRRDHIMNTFRKRIDSVIDTYKSSH